MLGELFELYQKSVAQPQGERAYRNQMEQLEVALLLRLRSPLLSFLLRSGLAYRPVAIATRGVICPLADSGSFLALLCKQLPSNCWLIMQVQDAFYNKDLLRSDHDYRKPCFQE